MRRSLTLFGAFVAAFLFSAAAAAEIAAPDPLRDAALAGNVDSQLALAGEFFFGTPERPRNPVLAVYWFRKAEELGSPVAAYNLGICHEKGWGVGEPSRILAYGFFEKAAKAGVPEAKLRRALLLYAGLPEEKLEKGSRPAIAADPVAALTMLRELTLAGYGPAQQELGALILADPRLRYEAGEEARTLLEAAAARNEPKALMLLAECLRDGIGGGADESKAADCYERAAELGDADAKAMLATVLEYGFGRKPDPKRAYELTCEAAAAGNAAALVRLGEYRLSGDFETLSLAGAVECFRKALAQDYLPGAVKLGRCFELGLGVEKDLQRAAELYGVAARGGNRDGQYAFGRCHLKGFGMEPDAAGAVFWFKTAAGAGQLEAIRELGICFLTGTGVEKDEAEGSRLLDAAAAGGDPEAILHINKN